MRNAVISACSYPFKFSAQCYLNYVAFTLFFGTVFANKITDPVIITAYLWTAMFALYMLILPSLYVQRKLLLAINPAFADSVELNRKRKMSNAQVDYLTQTTGIKNLTKSLRTSLRGVLPTSWRLLIAIALATYIFPQYFPIKSPEAILKFALVILCFDVIYNTVFSIILLKGITRDALAETGEEPPKRGAVSALVANVQDERAISLARHDLTIKMDPSATNYLERAKEHLQTKDAVPAIDDLDEAIKIAPDMPEAYEQRAEAYLNLKLDYFARNDLVKASKLYAEKFDTVSSDKINEKLRDLATKSSPYKADHNLWVLWSSIFSKDLKHSNEAKLNAISKDLESNHQSSSVYYRQAEVLFLQARYEEAFIACNKAIELNPDNGACYRMRAKLVCIRDLRVDEAIRDYDKAIKLNDKDADAYEERARLLLTIGDHESVVRDCTHALTFSKSYQFKLLRGSALVAMERYQDSLTDLSDFVSTWEQYIVFWDRWWFPAFRSIADGLRLQLAEAYEQRAHAYDRMGELDKAAHDVIQAARIKERDAKKNSKNKKQIR